MRVLGTGQLVHARARVAAATSLARLGARRVALCKQAPVVWPPPTLCSSCRLLPNTRTRCLSFWLRKGLEGGRERARGTQRLITFVLLHGACFHVESMHQLWP